MSQLGDSLPDMAVRIRGDLDHVLSDQGFGVIDAESVVTGRDFLIKIWDLLLSVPVGIAIVHSQMPAETLSNVFYELGMMQAYGKETLLVKERTASVPSDLVRTEYVDYDDRFESRLVAFLEDLKERAAYYAFVADQVERNPLLAIDYLRRAFLLTGDPDLRERARDIVAASGIEARASNSVEMLLAAF